jgi:hypothetical protein
VFESLNMITRLLLHKFINSGARKAVAVQPSLVESIG